MPRNLDISSLQQLPPLALFFARHILSTSTDRAVLALNKAIALSTASMGESRAIHCAAIVCCNTAYHNPIGAGASAAVKDCAAV
jgi:hypothetical protein